jgi:hypothetical protein
MIELVFEKVYTQYHGRQKLSALSEYLGNIPGSSTKKFVKMLVFGSKGAAIYNISDIQISPAIAGGSAAQSPGPKVVRIMYTGDESSKVMTMKQFASYCTQILSSLEGVDDKEIVLEAMLEGSNKGHSFRFYYDNSTAFALLVKNVNVEGLEEFLNNYEGDLVNAISVPQSTKAKAAKKADDHDGYVLWAIRDSFGHKVRVWKRADMVPADWNGRVQRDEITG